MNEFNHNLVCNQAGRKIIEASEKFEPFPYRDANGIPTIGYGHTLGVTLGAPAIDQSTGDQLMQDDLSMVEHALNNVLRYELNQNQFSALCSLVFNIGVGNFQRSSLLHVINSGDLDEAPDHIRLWIHDRNGVVLNGLVVRRNKEIELYNTPVEDADVAVT